MEVGRRKGAFRLRIIDLDTGKSKTTTVYAKNETKKPTLEEVMKKALKGFTEN